MANNGIDRNRKDKLQLGIPHSEVAYISSSLPILSSLLPFINVITAQYIIVVISTYIDDMLPHTTHMLYIPVPTAVGEATTETAPLVCARRSSPFINPARI